MKAVTFVARFLYVRAGLMKGNTLYEAGVIKMAVASLTQGVCSCVFPDACGHLTSKQREGAHIICMYTELSVSIRICVVNPKQVIN